MVKNFPSGIYTKKLKFYQKKINNNSKHVNFQFWKNRILEKNRLLAKNRILEKKSTFRTKKIDFWKK